MRILVADDDLTSRTLLTAVLNKFGHDSLLATNGEEAWELIRRPDAPRLIILDWMMPVLDGIEVLRRVRAELTGQQPYVLLLTNKTEKADIVAGLDAGADDYLPKPFNPSELRARIEAGRRIIEMEDQLAAQVEQLHRALDQIKTLHGILPICMHCKKIRDDTGYWEQVEAYVSRNTDALFSHAICPTCLKRYHEEDLVSEESLAEAQPDSGP